MVLLCVADMLHNFLLWRSFSNGFRRPPAGCDLRISSIPTCRFSETLSSLPFLPPHSLHRLWTFPRRHELFGPSCPADTITPQKLERHLWSVYKNPEETHRKQLQNVPFGLSHCWWLLCSNICTLVHQKFHQGNVTFHCRLPGIFEASKGSLRHLHAWSCMYMAGTAS